MNKTERRDILLSLVENVEIKRQEDIVELLRERGYLITQATISRDIKELGLVKIIQSNGSFRYKRPDNLRGTLNEMLESAVESIHLQGEMIKLDVVPGTAKSIKNMLRLRDEKEIFALLADDDTVLIIAKTKNDAEALYTRLKEN